MSIFCKLPFTHIYSDSYGMMLPCCSAFTDHPYKKHYKSNFPCRPLEDGVFSYQNIPEMQQLKKDMTLPDPYTDLVKDVCRACIHSEEIGLESNRQPIEDIPLFGRTYDLKLRIFGNTCNLSCFMCNIKNSSTRIRQTEKMIQYDEKVSEYLNYHNVPDHLKVQGGYDLATKDPDFFNQFLEDLKKFAPKIKQVTIIGGEPFIMPSHYKFLDALIECGESKNIILEYDSNLTALQLEKCHVEDYFDKFRLVSLSWSVEGYGKYDEYIRCPTNWDETVNNYKRLREHPNTDIGATITLSALAVLNLDVLCDWLKSEELKYGFNYLHSPNVCRIDHLHPTIRKRLSKKYANTDLDFLCKTLDEDVEDWETKWNDFLRYLKAIDFVNGTDYTKTFPDLCDLSEDR